MSHSTKTNRDFLVPNRLLFFINVTLKRLILSMPSFILGPFLSLLIILISPLSLKSLVLALDDVSHFRPGRGVGAPLELPKFLLIITVHCIEMYYFPPTQKTKKTFLFTATSWACLIGPSCACLTGPSCACLTGPSSVVVITSLTVLS